jgi:hypothetical protein
VHLQPYKAVAKRGVNLTPRSRGKGGRPEETVSWLCGYRSDPQRTKRVIENDKIAKPAHGRIDGHKRAETSISRWHAGHRR